MNETEPTERELEILKILWRRGEATVREVYEEISQRIPIVQNTVQAFLRVMEEKQLVTHRSEGRTFIYRPVQGREQTTSRLVSQLLERAFDGAVDQMVQSAFSVAPPSESEIARMESLLNQLRRKSNSKERRS